LIAQQGDDVEREWAVRILDRVPNYATIWEVYIGNDGSESVLPMPGATPPALEQRIEFWQRLYTLFESLALCWSIEGALILQPEVSNYKGYADNLNRWMAFYANLGRIYDMAEDVADQLRDRSLLVPLATYYQQRHIVLHGPKVPMKWVGNLLTAPELGELRGQWNDKKMRWSDVTGAEHRVLADHITRTISELEPLLDQFFGIVLCRLESRLGFKRVVWSAPVHEKPYGSPARGETPQVSARPFGSGISGHANVVKVPPQSIDPT
jgi:hypothetical protein